MAKEVAGLIKLQIKGGDAAHRVQSGRYHDVCGA